jgi:hypothetical protein
MFLWRLILLSWRLIVLLTGQVSSYGGFLSFTLETVVALDGGATFRDVDLEIIVSCLLNMGVSGYKKYFDV